MLEQSLSELASAQLIRPASEGEPAFLFKHALTQEAAYESLLLKTRRDLHRRVALAFEQLYPDQLDEHAATIARHYGEAGDVDKTLEYSRRAGDAAARVFAHPLALDHYGRAIEMAQAVSRSGGAAVASTHEAFLYLFVRRGRVLELSGQYQEAAVNYAQMEAEGKRLGDAELRLAAMTEHAKLLSTPNPDWDWVRGMKLAEEALAFAHQLGDREAQARLLWILQLANMYGTVDRDRAVHYGEESVALARQLGLREQLAYTLNDLGSLYSQWAEYAPSLALLKEAEGLWREMGNAPMLTDALGLASIDHFFLGEFQAALSHSEEGYRLGQAIDNEWSQATCRMMIGQVHMELGQFGRAIETMESTIRLGDQSGHPGVPVLTRALLAWALGELGAFQKGIEIARVAVERANSVPSLRPLAPAALSRLSLLQNDLNAAEAYLQEAESTLLHMLPLPLPPVFVMRARCELALARKDYSAALKVADQLLQHLQRTETRVFIYDALFLKAKGLLGTGQVGAANEVLREAETKADAVGSRRSLWAILLARSQLENERGQPEDGATLRSRAHTMVYELVESLYQPELRLTFEQRPEIQAALMAAE